MKARREKKSTNSQIGNIYKNRKRNIAIVILIAFCLFIIYKINFLTKSEENVKLTSVKFTEYDTKSVLIDDVGMYEDENGTYIILPEKVKGLYAQKYYVFENEDKEISEDIKNNEKDTNEIVQNVIENKVAENTTNSLISKAFQATNRKFLAEKTEDNIENTSNENVIVDDQNNDSNKSENTVTNSTEDNQTTVENKISENTTIDNKNSNTVSNTISNTTENNISDTNTVHNNSKNNLIQNKVSENNIEDNNVKNDNIEVDINGKSYLPGEKIYIDKKILDKDKAEFIVVYQTTEINNTKLYKQELNAEDNSINIDRKSVV